MQMCIYLGRKGTVQYCRKHADQVCPAGYVRTCPCIPEDFWNVDTYKKKPIKEISDPAYASENLLQLSSGKVHGFNRGSVKEKSENIQKQDKEAKPMPGQIKKIPIRSISIFKEN